MKLFILIATLLFSTSIFAQNERYELGKRTRALEIELEKQTTPELRKKAMSEINKAVQKFFAFNLREAARDLDNARFILEQKNNDEKIWAESLSVLPNFRVIDETNSSLNITVSPFYKVPQTIPNNALIRFSLMPFEGVSVKKITEFPISELPLKKQIALEKIKAGDYFLLTEIIVGKEVLAKNKQMFSVSNNVKTRISDLEKALNEAKNNDFQTETAREFLKILQNLVEGKTLETDYQANNLLNQAELFVKTPTKFSVKSGQQFLTLPLKSGNQANRILVPKNYDSKRETPILIALHGAGGSENLFFDSYGNGKVVELCEKRGWLLVAPRNFGFNAEKLDDFIEQLTKLYKINRNKIFLIGHSMGSVQSLNLVSQRPKIFAGVALISAGGQPKISDELKSMPFFIGTGTADFSLRGSANLNKILSEAGVKRIEYKVYDDIEHLTAVQFSLNDAFKFFDELK
jgi:predicted peptidase